MFFAKKNHLLILSVISFSMVGFAKADDYCLKVTNISGGECHTMVLTENSTVFACGDNYFRQLGIGPYGDQWSLTQTLDGQMWTFTDYLEDIIAIDAGWKHSLALDDDPCSSFVWSWGNDGRGQLGNGYGVSSRSTPIRVRAGEQSATDPNDPLVNIIAISAGRSGEYSLAVSDPCGFVWAWGYNNCGQLGNNENNTEEHYPVQVHGVNNSGFLMDIISVSAGEEHSMALEATDPCDPDLVGNVFCWGDNFRGKLGINSTQSSKYPKQVLKGQQDSSSNYLENIVIISAGWDHCMGLEKIDPCDPCCNGRVYTWGLNGIHPWSLSKGGRLGDGTEINRYTPVRVKSGQQDPFHADTFLQNIVSISAGEGHCMALDINGNVWTWGANGYG